MTVAKERMLEFRGIFDGDEPDEAACSYGDFDENHYSPVKLETTIRIMHFKRL